MCVQPPGSDYVAKGQSLFTKNKKRVRERERENTSPAGSEHSNNWRPATWPEDRTSTNALHVREKVYDVNELVNVNVITHYILCSTVY